MRPRPPALAFVAARQLLEAPVPFCDLPAPVPARFRPRRRKGLSAVSSPEPGHGAVWGEQLAQPPCAWDFFQLDHPAGGYPLRRPLALLQRERALLLAHTPQALALQCRAAGPVAPVNQLQVLGRGLPASAQDRARFALLLGDRVDQPLVQRIGFSLARPVRGIDPLSNRLAVLLFAAARHEADDPKPSHYSLLGATVLGAYHLNRCSDE